MFHGKGLSREGKIVNYEGLNERWLDRAFIREERFYGCAKIVRHEGKDGGNGWHRSHARGYYESLNIVRALEKVIDDGRGRL